MHPVYGDVALRQRRNWLAIEQAQIRNAALSCAQLACHAELMRRTANADSNRTLPRCTPRRQLRQEFLIRFPLSSLSVQQIVIVEQLRHVYRKGKVAVDGISFGVGRGEIFGLLGPNGAGKTTTVRMLTTILRPTSGRALVAGHDVAREPLAVRRNIVAVLQENAVETLLSTLDNLLLYGYLHGYSRAETRKRVDRVVEALELQEHLHSRAQTLSGGYKRRLQVAKALMIDTPVIFLDEATTGMDPLIKRRVVELIREEAARGRTVAAYDATARRGRGAVRSHGADERREGPRRRNHGRASPAGPQGISLVRALSARHAGVRRALISRYRRAA